MVIVSENGSRVFFAHDAWRQHCVEEKIQDPWELERKIEDEYTHYDKGERGSWSITFDTPTEDQKRRLKECHEYRDKYMSDRDIWVGNYLLKNYGYNDLTIFAQTHKKDETAFQEWFSNVRPCEGADGQCAFICPVFQTCPYKAQGQFQPGVEV